MPLKLAYSLAVIKYLGDIKRYISSLKVWVEPGDMLVCTQLDARYFLKANSVTKKFWETVEVKDMVLVPNKPIEAQDEELIEAQEVKSRRSKQSDENS